MSDKKILAGRHVNRIKDKFVERETLPTGYEEPATIPENTEKRREMEDIARNSIGYRMKDLYPDTYKTMTAIPSDVDYSKLIRADGLFEGCESLQEVNGLDLSSAVSAEKLFFGCTSLTKVRGLITPNVASFRQAFDLCINLSEIEEFDTSKCSDFGGMFIHCEKLPIKFPWTINMLNIPHIRDSRCGGEMFLNSSVKELDCKLSFEIPIAEKEKKAISRFERGKKIRELFEKTYIAEQHKEWHTSPFDVQLAGESEITYEEAYADEDAIQFGNINVRDIKFHFVPEELEKVVVNYSWRQYAVDNYFNYLENHMSLGIDDHLKHDFPATGYRKPSPEYIKAAVKDDSIQLIFAFPHEKTEGNANSAHWLDSYIEYDIPTKETYDSSLQEWIATDFVTKRFYLEAIKFIHDPHFRLNIVS